jgi:hypothetical protein
MSEAKIPNRLAAIERRVPAGPTPAHARSGDPVDAYGAWLNRMKASGGRHAAITKNLYSWTNYKSWADKIRGDWDAKK